MFTRRAWRGVAPNADGLIGTSTYIWNTGTLAWEPATGSAGAGSVTVTNFPATQAISAASLPLPSGAATQATLSSLLTELQLKADLSDTQPVSGPLTDAELRAQAIDVASEVLASRIDEASGTITYVGKAAAGAFNASASWQIYRMTTSGVVLTIEFADGDSNFDNVWNNRASLTYS